MSSATSTRGLESVPLHQPLSAKYTSTFAYPTIKDRSPTILCKVIDHLYRERQNIKRDRGTEAAEGLKKVVESLSKLRYEMQTDKPITELDDGIDNANIWNQYLEERKTKEGECSWYKSAWLWVECYMYRRIAGAVSLIPQLQGLDYFRVMKEEGFYSSLSSIRLLTRWLLDPARDMTSKNNLSATFSTLVYVCLWGNKCDLSISAGSKQAASGDPVEAVEGLRENVLVDQVTEIWDTLERAGEGALVDVVMDNSGFELFTDLCLADFLVTSGIAKQVRLRIKDMPWFVSDTTPQDFHWFLDKLATDNCDNSGLLVLGNRWRGLLDSGAFTLEADPFWTFPHDFSQMSAADPQLYSRLAEADLVIFKGDLNYRKLVGDLNWETTATFQTALQGFLPTNVASLRTLKADVVTGMEPGKAEEISKKDPNWMESGNWGVIQLARR